MKPCFSISITSPGLSQPLAGAKLPVFLPLPCFFGDLIIKFLPAFEKYPAHLRRSFSNSTLAFLDTFPSDWPEAEYLPLAYATIPANVSSTDNYLLLGSALLSTSSRGNMTITSADTLDPPLISPNWLLDEGDAEQAVAALRRIREIAAASGIVESEYVPGANVSSYDEILDWLRNNMDLIYHASSTCKCFSFGVNPSSLLAHDPRSSLNQSRRG